MRCQSKGLKLFGRWFRAGGIIATVELSGDRQAGIRSRGADEVENLLISVEWFACPVLGYFGKETMFNGVPFGSASRVVRHGEGQAEGVGQLRLEFGFPGAATSAIAAAGVAQDEELTGAGIAYRAFLAPPMCNGVRRKGGCVMRDADHHRPSIGQQVIDPVRNGDTGRVGAEVVVIDQAGRKIPARAGILEVADQFALLGVDTNDG